MDTPSAPVSTARCERLAGGIDVWLASTDAASDPGVERACRAMLTGAEIAECDAFRQEPDRRRAVVTRALVRTTLSRYWTVAPETWRFERAAGGRPEIAAPGARGLRFSLSHTRELVACAVTIGTDVGIDVERATEHADLARLAETVFAPAELQDFLALAPEHRSARFYAAWTLKEAYLKARGLGLALPPACVGFDLGTPGRVGAWFGPEAQDEPRNWWFGLLASPASHTLALAARFADAPRRVDVSVVTPPFGDAVTTRPAEIVASTRGCSSSS